MVIQQGQPMQVAVRPVLVWIYGGGYTAREKAGFGPYNPASLVEAGWALALRPSFLSQ